MARFATQPQLLSDEEFEDLQHVALTIAPFLKPVA